MPRLKDKLRDMEIETCYQSCQESTPKLIYIIERLKETKNKEQLKNIALTIEDLVLKYEKIPLKVEEKEELLPQEIIDKIRRGRYNHRDFILDVYHTGIDRNLLFNEFKKINKSSSYGSIEAWATMKLNKYEKQAQESREPIEIKDNERIIYVDSRRGIHLDREEAVEANKGYLEDNLNIIRNRS